MEVKPPQFIYNLKQFKVFLCIPDHFVSVLIQLFSKVSGFHHLEPTPHTSLNVPATHSNMATAESGFGSLVLQLGKGELVKADGMIIQNKIPIREDFTEGPQI